ncbi:ROK family protein [Streptacidiphilus rugosus]|uniref:ROK family protein n=1 Tax=Streptacidiphilus rugosus TaxID=405783 RepID=UPI000567CA34|nr:ROK family protein [Streptacidiphilus rugosus]
MTQTHTSPERGRAVLGPALELIHTGAAPTRSVLTGALGVTRTTVGAITSELEALRLISVDARPAGGSRGRPSHRLEIDPQGPVVLAAQLHTDGFTLALAGLGGRIGQPLDLPLDPGASPQQVLRAMADEAVRLVEASPRRCVGAGLAAPTPVTEPERVAVISACLGWPTGTPIGELWTQALRDAGLALPDGVAPAVANDANLAALAEHRHGAGRGARHLLYVTSGHQGVGGALVVDGRLHTGSAGLALEIGQLTVDPEGLLCRCGRRGCLDVEAGPPALLAAYGLPPEAPLAEVDAVLAAARSGEAVARAAVEHVAERLGRGIAAVVDILNPDRIVLGPFHSALLAGAPELLPATIAARAHWGRYGCVPLHPAELAAPELAGAAELAWAPVLAEPQLAAV